MKTKIISAMILGLIGGGHAWAQGDCKYLEGNWEITKSYRSGKQIQSMQLVVNGLDIHQVYDNTSAGVSLIHKEKDGTCTKEGDTYIVKFLDNNPDSRVKNISISQDGRVMTWGYTFEGDKYSDIWNRTTVVPQISQASSDVNSPDNNADKRKSNTAVTTPAGYGSNSGGRSQVLVDAGKCKIYSENEPVGKVDWKGPCAKGFANGEGITRYYSADNQLFAIGKDRYQKGQYKSTKDAYFLNEGKIMRKPKKSASESAEEVPTSAVPAWAREITGQDSSAFASNGKSQNNANASSKGIPLRAVFSFDMNDDNHRDPRSDGPLPIVRPGAGRGESEIRNLAEFRADIFCHKGSFECTRVSNLKIQKTCKGPGFVAFAKISTKNDADFLGYHWWADCLDKKNLSENIPSIKKQLSEGLAQARIVDYAFHEFSISYVDENNINDIQKISEGAGFVDDNYFFTCKEELDKNLGYSGAPTTFDVEACIRNIESEYKSRFGKY